MKITEKLKEFVNPIHKRLTLTYVGRIHREKDVRLIIDFTERVRDKVKLIFVGQVQDKGYLMELKTALNKGNYRYKFTGFLDKKRMQSVFQKTDFLINLCRIEAFGRVFVEALASGVPCIAYRGTGADSIIRHGKNGYLIKTRKELEKIVNDNSKAGIVIGEMKCRICGRMAVHDDESGNYFCSQNCSKIFYGVNIIDRGDESESQLEKLKEDRTNFEHSSWRKAKHDLIKKFLGQYEVKEKNILECGCGLVPLYERSRKVDITDLKGELKSFTQSDLNRRLPFGDDSFESIIALDVIEHLHNLDKFLDECNRVLKSRHFLILSTPNLFSWRNQLSMIFMKENFSSKQYMDYGHYVFFDPSSLKKLLEDHGFNVVFWKALGNPILEHSNLYGEFLMVAVA